MKNEGGCVLDTVHLIWERVMVCLFTLELIFFLIHKIYLRWILMRIKLSIGCSCYQVRVNTTFIFGLGKFKKYLSDVIIVPTEQCLDEYDARYFMSIIVIF